MTMDPFASPGGQSDGDPFTAPAVISSEFPKLVNMRGRLLMMRPIKYDQGIPSRFRNSDGTVQLQNRMSADVHVIDGGPVIGDDGQPFDTVSFTAMYISNDRLCTQLLDGLENRHMVLGRLDTYKPGEKAAAGNPWGLSDPTEADKQAARAFIAAGYKQTGQPAPAAPQFQAPPAAPAPAANPWGPQAPQPVAAAPAAPPNWGAPVQPVPGANPWG